MTLARPLSLAVVLVASAAQAAPSVAPTPAPTPTIVTRPTQLKIKPVSELTMNNVGTVPGEKRTYEAVLKLKAGTAPLGKRKVTFRIEPKNGSTVPNGAIAMGDAETDDQGRARLDYSMADLAQGNYTLKASFGGDDDLTSSKVEANLLVVKATTKIELSNLMWGTYKNEPGSPYGTIGISLVRTSDNKGLARPLTITVNGKTWTLPGTGYHQVVLQPMNAASWNVKVQFEGDDTAIATGAERTYTKPN